MTGFARTDGSVAGYSWVWEVKSVNSKGLDLRFRLPHGFDALEAQARKRAVEKFVRGNLSINLVIQRPKKPAALEINRPVLEKMMSLAAEYRGSADAVNVENLMGLRGVIELVEEDIEEKDTIAMRDTAVIASLEELFDSLTYSRSCEGKRLAGIVEEHIGEIASLTAEAAGLVELQPERIKGRLMDQLGELLHDDNSLSEDRIAQELALIVVRGDVREELDRLVAHVAAARELMGEGVAVGRRLDFLCQEFNREANTLCSKSSDMDLTRIGLALKSAIERLREQIQNIE
ncbi:MAG: YicC/YloC family endoribonuclease [Pseudomonadota bacterium]|nr:YicC/YloC family endoribonuclease [Pseudomonadota bacterium]